MSEDPALIRLRKIGDAYIALGKAIRNPRTPIRDVAAAANTCGLYFQFRLVPMTDDDPDEVLP